MPRQRSPNRDKAFDIYKDYKGDITLREIANILETSEKTISGWKAKDKWDDKLNGVLQKKNVKNTEYSKRKKVNKKSKKEPIADEVKDVLENAELTDKQRLFCIYQVKYFNATKAYQKAYGCDYITANAHGYELLSNVVIKSEIDRLKRSKLNRAMLEPDDIFQKYMDIAFSDITDYIEFGQKRIKVKDDSGKERTIKRNYVDFNNSSEIDGTIISEVSQGKDGVKIKLHDKMKALDWLTEHIDMATEEQKLKCEKLKSEIDKSKNNDNGEPIEIVIKRKTE